MYIVVKEDKMSELPKLGFSEGKKWLKLGGTGLLVDKETREVVIDAWDRKGGKAYIPVELFDMIQSGIVVKED